MEVLGLLMTKSLINVIEKEDVGEEKYEKLNEAYLVFFKSITYWIQFGFNFQSKSSL